MYAANISINNKSNDDTRCWKKWCRLCAGENVQNVNILVKTENATTPTENAEENKTIVSAIEKYFCLDIKKVEGFPNHICTVCFSLVTYIVDFNERVAKVQEMFSVLHNSHESSDVDIPTLRLKYNIKEDDRLYKLVSSTLQEPQLNENFFGLNDYKARNLETLSEDSRTTIDIKRESAIDILPVVGDEGVCEFENENVEDDDPFGSDIESKARPQLKCVDERLKGKKVLKKNVTSISKKKKKIISKKLVKTKTLGTETTEIRYFCSKCSQSFQRIGSYRVHLNKKHGIVDVPTFSCAKCSRSFQNAYNLKRHMETHRPTSEKKIFPCPQCDRKFQTKDYVATHIKFVHEDIRPLICEECGEGVRTQGALREHMLTHTDYAPFECDVCKKGFKNQSRLKNHLEIHSSDKHICTECGLQLNSRVTLNRHMLVHSDAMQHRCDYCGRAFKRAKTLKSHLILHSGIKPYSCEFCDRTFTSGSNCRTHMKRAHPNDLAELEASGEKKYTKNIPKLAVLKSVMKKAENLLPVVSKQSGNFSLGKKPMRQPHGLDYTEDISPQNPVAPSSWGYTKRPE